MRAVNNIQKTLVECSLNRPQIIQIISHFQIEKSVEAELWYNFVRFRVDSFFFLSHFGEESNSSQMLFIQSHRSCWKQLFLMFFVF